MNQTVVLFCNVLLILLALNTCSAQYLRHENYTDPIFPLLEGIRAKIKGEKQSIMSQHEQEKISLWTKVDQAKELVDKVDEKIHESELLLEQQKGMKQAYTEEYEQRKAEAEQSQQNLVESNQKLVERLRQELKLVDRIELLVRAMRRQASSLNELCDDVSVFCDDGFVCSHHHHVCKAQDLHACQSDSDCISSVCKESQCVSNGLMNVYTDGIPIENINNWNHFALAVDIGNTQFDTVHSYSSRVIKDGDIYKMWYTGEDDRNTHRILYCESEDGQNWNNPKLVVNSGASGTGYDHSSSSQASVIKDENKYKMWYTGNYRILYSESFDGIQWENFTLAVDVGASGTGLDSHHSYYPTVIKENVYKMWYGAFNGNNVRIMYCESQDGIQWNNFQLAVDRSASGTGLDSTHSLTPFVMKDGSMYRMWYSGYDGRNNRIIYTESQDGVHWENYQLALNLQASSLGYDSTHVYFPSVIKEQNKLKMWYSGRTSWSSIRILYTESQ